jgi:hypothetical protein
MHFPKPSVQSIVRYEHEQGVQKNQHVSSHLASADRAASGR